MRRGLAESLPLLAASVALFGVGVIAWAHGIEIGSAKFPLAELLVALGFVAAIGAVLSWFFAGEPAGISKVSETPAAPKASEVAEPLGGRPRPDVRVDPTGLRPAPRAELAPWDEGPVDEVPPPPRTYPAAVIGRQTQLILDEIDGIDRDVVSRRERDPGNRQRATNASHPGQ